jgi:hypothetical protein
MTDMSKTLPIYGLAVLTVFGVAYDAGFFGATDGHDHSAIVAMPGATGSVGLSNGVILVTDNITGDEIKIAAPDRNPRFRNP